MPLQKIECKNFYDKQITAQLSNVEVQVLDKKTKLMYPVIEDRDIEGSVYIPKDGQADPVGVTNVLAKAAKWKE